MPFVCELLAVVVPERPAGHRRATARLGGADTLLGREPRGSCRRVEEVMCLPTPWSWSCGAVAPARRRALASPRSRAPAASEASRP